MARGLLQRLRGLLWRRRPPRHLGDAEIAAFHRRLLRPCPACGRDLAGHAQFRLASEIVGASVPAGAASPLAALVEAGRWEEASRFEEWKPLEDVREHHVIRCPVTGRLSLVTAISVAEFWANDVVEATRILDERDAAAVEAIVGDRWRQL